MEWLRVNRTSVTHFNTIVSLSQARPKPTHPFIHQPINAAAIMTRVSNAAAITIQTWSRTVLAKKQASAERQRQQMLKAKSLDEFERAVSMEVVARRFLMVAACITLLGLTTQTAAAGGGPQVVLASSPAVDAESPSRVFQAIAGALPSLLRSHRG